jgi:hypothetical protein
MFDNASTTTDLTMTHDTINSAVSVSLIYEDLLTTKFVVVVNQTIKYNFTNQ